MLSLCCLTLFATYLAIPDSTIQIFTLPNDDLAIMATGCYGAGSEACVGGPGHVPDPVCVALQFHFLLPQPFLVTAM